jgi:predicted metal-dependent hydrolase
MGCVRVQNTTINYILRYTGRKKTIGIRITGKDRVFVNSPRGYSREYIERLILRKKDWIIRKSSSFEHSKSYVRGDTVLFLGEQHRVSPVVNPNAGRKECTSVGRCPSITRGIIHVPEEGPPVKEALKDLFKREAKLILERRVQHYSGLMGVAPKKVLIKENRSTWGSCTSKKTLNFCYRIIMAPPEIIDYIVVHELAHLIHRGHQRDFWKTVEQYITDVKHKRKWLGEWGNSLIL